MYVCIVLQHRLQYVLFYILELFYSSYICERVLALHEEKKVEFLLFSQEVSKSKKRHGVSLLKCFLLHCYMFKMEDWLFFFFSSSFFGCLVPIVTAVHLLTRLALAVTAKLLEQTPSAHYFSIQCSRLFQPLCVSMHAEERQKK